MKMRTYTIVAFILATAGTLFSGYLSAVKLFTKNCALNEPCPIFWGYPACWYGFGMFFLMFIITLTMLIRSSRSKGMIALMILVSGVGVLFAGQYAVPELQYLMDGGEVRYMLGLSTCMYGFFFFCLIFLISLISIFRKREPIIEHIVVN